MANQWLHYEITFLIMNYNKLSYNLIARALKKDVDEIIQMVNELNVSDDVSNPILKLKSKPVITPINSNITPEIQTTTAIQNVPNVRKREKSNPLRKIDKHHGVYIYKPDHPYANKNGYILEHRLVIEKMLGRYLKPFEQVFRKDNDVLNNSCDNLYIKDFQIDNIGNRFECEDVDNIENQCKDNILVEEIIVEGKPLEDEEKPSEIIVDDNVSNKNNKSDTKKIIKTSNIGEIQKTFIYRKDLSFEKNAFIYFRNRNYNKQSIMRILKIDEKKYISLQKSTGKFVNITKSDTTSELTIFTLLRIKRKHNKTITKIVKSYKMSGTQKKALENKAKTNNGK